VFGQRAGRAAECQIYWEESLRGPKLASKLA
jgi:hypothetical protein